MTTVRPLFSFLTVMRFSKEARSWAKATAESTTNNGRVLKTRYFIEPPVQIGTKREGKICSYVRTGRIVKLGCPGIQPHRIRRGHYTKHPARWREGGQT